MNTCQSAYPQCTPADMRPTHRVEDTTMATATALGEIQILKGCWEAAIRYYEAIISALPADTAFESKASEKPPRTSALIQYSNKVPIYSRIQRRNWVADKYPGLSFDIERIRTRKRDWGKAGSKNPSDATLDYAYEVLYELARYSRSLGISFPEPAVGRCADGSVLFEWDLPGKSFELEFSKENQTPHLSYLLCPSEDDDSTWQEDEIIGALTDHLAVRTFLSWA